MLRNNLDKPNDDIKEETECQSKLEHNYALNSNNVQATTVASRKVLAELAVTEKHVIFLENEKCVLYCY